MTCSRQSADADADQPTQQRQTSPHSKGWCCQQEQAQVLVAFQVIKAALHVLLGASSARQKDFLTEKHTEALKHHC